MQESELFSTSLEQFLYHNTPSLFPDLVDLTINPTLVVSNRNSPSVFNRLINISNRLDSPIALKVILDSRFEIQRQIGSVSRMMALFSSLVKSRSRDLIIELGQINNANGPGSLIWEFLNTIDVSEYSRVVVSSGAYPSSISNSSRLEKNTFFRWDFELWNRYSEVFRDSCKNLVYGDHTARYLRKSVSKITAAFPSRYIVYTDPLEFLLLKGDNKRGNDGQWAVMCKRLVESENFRKGASLGDINLVLIARGQKKMGNHTKMLTYAINSHMEFAIRQLSDLTEQTASLRKVHPLSRGSVTRIG